MADVSAAKREARRRRILENSENRLKKIAGISKAEISLSKACFPDVPKKDEVLPSDVTPKDNGSFARCSTDTERESRLTEPTDSHSTVPVLNDHSEVQQRSRLNVLLSARLHLVGLAGVVRFLLYINYGFLFSESVFVPLWTVEVAEYVIRPSILHANGPRGTLGAALMLSGISSQRIAVMNNILCTLQQCVQDCYIYFFSFIMVHVLVEILR